MKSFTYLWRLQISHNPVNSQDLSNGLKCCNSLQELHISSCKIHSSGAKEIASSLSKTCHVLDISINAIDSLADVLSRMKHHSSLSHLYLNENSSLHSSNYLDFSNCTQLQTLNVSEISIEDEELLPLSNGLQHCTILQHLYIAGNSFTTDGLTALAIVLKYFPMLQTLDVSGNIIGDEGAEILADSLQNNPILTTLCIFHCRISQTGIRALETALSSIVGRARVRIVSTHCLSPPVFESKTFC